MKCTYNVFFIYVTATNKHTQSQIPFVSILLHEFLVCNPAKMLNKKIFISSVLLSCNLKRGKSIPLGCCPSSEFFKVRSNNFDFLKIVWRQIVANIFFIILSYHMFTKLILLQPKSIYYWSSMFNPSYNNSEQWIEHCFCIVISDLDTLVFSAKSFHYVNVR